MKIKIVLLMTLVVSCFILMLTFPVNENVTPRIQDDCTIQMQTENLAVINIIAAPMPDNIAVVNVSDYQYAEFSSAIISRPDKEEMGVLKTLLTPSVYFTDVPANNLSDEKKLPNRESVFPNIAIVRLL